MSEQKKYWFPAKHYGWGWSLPTCWQGWAVFIAYGMCIALIRQIFPPAREHSFFLAGMAISTVTLGAVCLIKGEPPRWRRGR